MSDCILHKGSINDKGYGRNMVDGITMYAHRRAWTEVNGLIPEGMQINHKCDVPLCINVDHLYMGTQVDNVRDRTVRGRHYNTVKTHCKHGHEFNEENTYVREGIGRNCRACRRKSQ